MFFLKKKNVYELRKKLYNLGFECFQKKAELRLNTYGCIPIIYMVVQGHVYFAI